MPGGGALLVPASGWPRVTRRRPARGRHAPAEAARELAERFGCSTRQGHRYVQRADPSGHVAVPARTEVFTVKLPAPLIARIRGHAAASGRTISAVVAQALEEFLARARRDPPRR